MSEELDFKKSILLVGLGLIGGSMAKAIRVQTNCKILGYDISPKVCNDALDQAVIDEICEPESFHKADMVLVSIYPKATVDFLLGNMQFFKSSCIIVDLCGVKEYICNGVTQKAKEHGLHFIGGHPMAGREFSGFEYSKADLYNGASMILVPQDQPKEIVEQVRQFFLALGFKKVVSTTAKKHDAMIAFTSQLAHIVSSAYIKSPQALKQDGFSAGSYKDLTRVASLNEFMWSELFMHNSEALVTEIDEIIKHLTDYRNIISEQNETELRRMLKEGSDLKKSIG